MISCRENANIDDAVRLGLQLFSLLSLGCVWIMTVRGHMFPPSCGPYVGKLHMLALINIAKHQRVKCQTHNMFPMLISGLHAALAMSVSATLIYPYICCTVQRFLGFIPLIFHVSIICISVNCFPCQPESYIAIISFPQNAFVQLSLAFRNDNYTLETRLKQAERERNLTEENTEKELEEFKGSLKVSP